jgi:hypothetical protein
MWFLLAFGALTLVCAAGFAARPDYSRLRLTSALAIATLFTTLTAISADLAAVGHQVPSYLARHPELTLSVALLQGAAESMSPAILGFTVLSLAALLVALGCYRDPSAVT